jgi:hypothetical protein
MQIKQGHLATQAVEFGWVDGTVFEDSIVNQCEPAWEGSRLFDGRLRRVRLQLLRHWPVQEALCGEYV